MFLTIILCWANSSLIHSISTSNNSFKRLSSRDCGVIIDLSSFSSEIQITIFYEPIFAWNLIKKIILLVKICKISKQPALFTYREHIPREAYLQRWLCLENQLRVFPHPERLELYGKAKGCVNN